MVREGNDNVTEAEKIMSCLEGLAEPDWRLFHSDSEVQNIAKNALELLKEQQKIIEQYQKADSFLNVHGWKWN